MSTDLPPQSHEELPHKPTEDDTEQIYYQGSPLMRGSLGRLILCWLIALLFFVTPFIWHAVQHDWPIWWMALALLVLGLIALFIPVIATHTISYRITNYRIDYERGLLSRNIDTLELWHVEDLAFHQSLLDRMLNVGTITVISHDETMPKLLMHGLPNPRPLFESLKQRVISVKRQRGVIKMDPG
jgi:membrane protein YdbS with pleckstrin-like domain